MKAFFACLLATLAAQASSAPSGSKVCGDWTISPLQHTSNPKQTFVANDQVTLKWNTTNSQIQYIGDIGLFSSKNEEFLHTQYRSYPGVSASENELSFTLTVPLCLQREGEYFLGVYASTPDRDSNCYIQTDSFQLIADPNGNYTICDL